MTVWSAPWPPGVSCWSDVVHRLVLCAGGSCGRVGAAVGTVSAMVFGLLAIDVRRSGGRRRWTSSTCSSTRRAWSGRPSARCGHGHVASLGLRGRGRDLHRRRRGHRGTAITGPVPVADQGWRSRPVAGAWLECHRATARPAPGAGPAPAGPGRRRCRLTQPMTASSIARPPYHRAGKASMPGHRHSPAAVRVGAPDHERDRERQPHEERDRHRGPRAVRPAIRVSTSPHSNQASGSSRTTRPRSGRSPPARWRATATRPGRRTTAARSRA